MARRQPITNTALRGLARERFRENGKSAASLDDALRPILEEIPANKRDAVIAALSSEIQLYRTNRLISGKEGPGSAAESLQLCIGRLKEAQPALLELPAIPRARLSGAAPQCFETHGKLQGLIDAAEAEIARLNEQVSPAAATREKTRLRNDLAVGLKGIALGILGKDDREAEMWATQVFDVLGIAYPDPDEHAADFKQIFFVAPNRTPPSDHLERLAEARLVFALRREEASLARWLEAFAFAFLDEERPAAAAWAAGKLAALKAKHPDPAALFAQLKGLRQALKKLAEED
jgi:hypothetical protein